MFSSEPFHDIKFGVSRLLKTLLTQYLSSEEVYSHPEGPPEKRKRLHLARLALLKACSSILIQTEQKYPARCLHVWFAKKKQKADVGGLFTEDGL